MNKQFLLNAKVGDRVKSRGGEEGEIIGIFPDHPYPVKVQFSKRWCSCRYDGLRFPQTCLYPYEAASGNEDIVYLLQSKDYKDREEKDMIILH